MGTKTEALATQFEATAREATAILEKLSDADWKKVTAAEKWSVGVTAHHVAGAHEPIANIVRTLAAGQSVPYFTTAMLDELNAQHARDFAGVGKSETVALHAKGVAAAAAVVRSLRDDQLANAGTVFADAPPKSAGQMISEALIGHIDQHFASIRRTILSEGGHAMGNPFVHVELMATDVAKARTFYGKLFDWTLEDMPMPDGTYTLIKVGEGTGGGIMKNPIPGAPSSFVPYVLVDDLKAATGKAATLGAKVMKDVTEVPGAGSFTLITDPTGALLGLWQPKKS